MTHVQTFTGKIVSSDRGPCLVDHDGITWRLRADFDLELPVGREVQLRGALQDAATIAVAHAALQPQMDYGS